jgi:hypothetical protein
MGGPILKDSGRPSIALRRDRSQTTNQKITGSLLEPKPYETTRRKQSTKLGSRKTKQKDQGTTESRNKERIKEENKERYEEGARRTRREDSITIEIGAEDVLA